MTEEQREAYGKNQMGQPSSFPKQWNDDNVKAALDLIPKDVLDEYLSKGGYHNAPQLLDIPKHPDYHEYGTTFKQPTSQEEKPHDKAAILLAKAMALIQFKKNYSTLDDEVVEEIRTYLSTPTSQEEKFDKVKALTDLVETNKDRIAVSDRIIALQDKELEKLKKAMSTIRTILVRMISDNWYETHIDCLKIIDDIK